MGRQTFASLDVTDFPPASHTAVANTTTRTNLWVPALWTPIPAFDMKPGKVYELMAGGIISCTGTPTIIFNPTFGASATPGTNLALGVSRTITLGSGLTNVPWFARFILGCRQIGIAAAGATITGNGQLNIQGVAGAVDQDIGFGGTVVTNADHTTAQGLCLDVTWSAASASNTITAQWTTIRSLN